MNARTRWRILELIEDPTDGRLSHTKVAALLAYAATTAAFAWQTIGSGVSEGLLLAYGGLLTGTGLGAKFFQLRFRRKSK